MANQFQVDRSEDFASKMTLITETSSDKYLKQYRMNQEEQRTLESLYTDRSI